MNSLLFEIVFCVLFLYLLITTFIAEFVTGFLQSLLCVFGWASIEGTEEAALGFPLFYYSYVIFLSLLGNMAFVLSLVVYGPVWFTTQTQFSQKRQAIEGREEVPLKQYQLLYCSGRRFGHICVFTRYDVYASLVLIFISIQFLFQQTLQIYDFKEIEGMVFKKTVANFRANYSEESCLSDWCDHLMGRRALKGINELQQEMQCCGWTDAKDWLSVDDQNYEQSVPKTLSLPKSCCFESALNCSLDHNLRFSSGCNDYDLPVGRLINPTQYSNHCFGLYPIFKFLAIVSYQFSFRKIFDGSALLLRVNLFFAPNIRIV